MNKHILNLMLALTGASIPVWAFAASVPLTSSQPAEERQAQNSLPIASGEVWNTLSKSTITYSTTAPHITAKLTPEIRAMNGKTVSVDGFMLPMDGAENSSHFLLSKRTPTCFFCPPGEPNEVLEVFSTKGIRYGDAMLHMQGRFELTNNTENGVFFVLKDATSQGGKAPAYTVPLLGKDLP